jgi:hypothetical protein
MEINPLTAYCGLRCDSCPIYLASIESDLKKQSEMRIQIARTINERYHMILRPEDITDCDGCRTPNGRLYFGCSQCEIRKCARAKDCFTCGHCSEYPCDHLQKFIITEPSTQDRLDEIRKNL